MTKRSGLGILVIVVGLGLMVFSPQTQSCTTDYDLTICEVTGNAIFNGAGLVFIAAGATLALIGLPRRSS